ncbi:MAG: META domain-containing protein [Segetibacter sp.]
MKKIIYVLPLFVFFAYCSSSKKAATPVTPGISNLNVTRNDTVTSAANASSSFTSSDRDWSYAANRDTTLNGTWILEGMSGTDGNWSSTQSGNKDSALAAATDTAMEVISDTTSTATSTETSEAKSMGKRGKGKAKNNRRAALYDSAQARLKMDYKTTSTSDTSAQPFQYWGRIPTVTLNATKRVFTGTTGCNSMSGSFNFNNKDIQFGRNIVTSKMSCNEYNETNFLSALKKADSYTLNGNTLELKQGGTLLLTFKKA